MPQFRTIYIYTCISTVVNALDKTDNAGNLFSPPPLSPPLAISRRSCSKRRYTLIYTQEEFSPPPTTQHLHRGQQAYGEDRR